MITPVLKSRKALDTSVRLRLMRLTLRNGADKFY
jgi:hypothetical protein